METLLCFVRENRNQADTGLGDGYNKRRLANDIYENYCFLGFDTVQ